MAALPRGTRTGNMLHQLYENLSFDAEPSQIRDEVGHQLTAHGLSVHEWSETVARHTLDFFHSDLGGFKLANISQRKRLNELAFHFPIGELTMKRLETFFEEHQLPQRPNQFDFYPVEGYLKGFIDLVVEHHGQFYIIDYKSNFLGDEDECYHSSRLSDVMNDSNYVLQYHLYVAALHRYLRYRFGKRLRLRSSFRRRPLPLCQRNHGVDES